MLHIQAKYPILGATWILSIYLFFYSSGELDLLSLFLAVMMIIMQVFPWIKVIPDRYTGGENSLRAALLRRTWMSC